MRRRLTVEIKVTYRIKHFFDGVNQLVLSERAQNGAWHGTRQKEFEVFLFNLWAIFHVIPLGHNLDEFVYLQQKREEYSLRQKWIWRKAKENEMKTLCFWSKHHVISTQIQSTQLPIEIGLHCSGQGRKLPSLMKHGYVPRKTSLACTGINSLTKLQVFFVAIVDRTCEVRIKKKISSTKSHYKYTGFSSWIDPCGVRLKQF